MTVKISLQSGSHLYSILLCFCLGRFEHDARCTSGQLESEENGDCWALCSRIMRSRWIERAAVYTHILYRLQRERERERVKTGPVSEPELLSVHRWEEHKQPFLHVTDTQRYVCSKPCFYFGVRSFLWWFNVIFTAAMGGERCCFRTVHALFYLRWVARLYVAYWCHQIHSHIFLRRRFIRWLNRHLTYY